MLPEHLRDATPEEVFAWHQKNARKATMTAEECRQLFRARMVREKRGEELDSRIAGHRDEGKSRRSATYAAMNEMGYAGPANEKKLFYRAEAQGMQDWHRKMLSVRVKNYRLRKKIMTIEEAIAKLPPTAQPDKELDWIRSHPAMGRRYLLPADSEEKVEVTVEDVKDGPSRAAAYALMDWAQRPSKFQDFLMTENKKKSGGPDATAEGVVESGTKNIRAMLDRINSRKKPDA